MKRIFRFAFMAMLSLFFTACETGGGGETPGGGEELVGVYYVLNSGDWKSNNSSLTKYDGVTGKVTQFCFEQQNGRGLGNTANDIVAYGSKMYIAVAGESTIEVTDLNAKSIKQIKCDAQPRYLATAGGKVYISYYDGYVARLDTTVLEVEAKVAVGRNPEQLAVVGNRLYVANSGGMDYNTPVGYDKTVSVVDLNSFEEIKRLDVVLNPSVLVPCKYGLFVASYGNYADVPSTLQYIDVANDAVSVVEKCQNMTELCYNHDALYGFCTQYDNDWNSVTTYISYDIASGVVETPWIKENVLPVPYKVCSVDVYVCVTSSDYVNDGDVYVYDVDGMLVRKIAAGLNPVKMVKAE